MKNMITAMAGLACPIALGTTALGAIVYTEDYSGADGWLASPANGPGLFDPNTVRAFHSSEFAMSIWNANQGTSGDWLGGYESNVPVTGFTPGKELTFSVVYSQGQSGQDFNRTVNLTVMYTDNTTENLTSKFGTVISNALPYTIWLPAEITWNLPKDVKAITKIEIGVYRPANVNQYGMYAFWDDVQIAVVPEPASAGLVTLVIGAMATRRRRR